MTEKNLKTCSAFLSQQGNANRNFLRFHLMPVRMVMISERNNRPTREDVEQGEHLPVAEVGVPACTATLEISAVFLRENLKAYARTSFSHRDTFSTLFIAALFITARNWKQGRRLSTADEMKKIWYIYTVLLHH